VHRYTPGSARCHGSRAEELHDPPSPGHYIRKKCRLYHDMHVQYLLVACHDSSTSRLNAYKCQG